MKKWLAWLALTSLAAFLGAYYAVSDMNPCISVPLLRTVDVGILHEV